MGFFLFTVLAGASSGIGAGSALNFVKQGAKVVLNARNLEKLNNVAKSCATTGALQDKVT